MIDPATGDLSTLKEWVGWVVAGLTGFALTAMTLMRKYSKLGVDRASDGAQVAGIKDLQTRNAKLEEQISTAYSERNAAMRSLGGLEVEVRLLNVQMTAAHSEYMLEQRRIQGRLEERERQLDIANRRITQLLEANFKELRENTALTQEVIVQAGEAFREANDVNTKIRDIGLTASRANREGEQNILKAIAADTAMSERAADRADAAYKEANTVNQKLKEIGVEMRDGQQLEEKQGGTPVAPRRSD